VPEEVERDSVWLLALTTQESEDNSVELLGAFPKGVVSTIGEDGGLGGGFGVTGGDEAAGQRKAGDPLWVS
jgi:hypothetical protein